jgi:hypothetical protein
MSLRNYSFQKFKQNNSSFIVMAALHRLELPFPPTGDAEAIRHFRRLTMFACVEFARLSFRGMQGG